jgi:hypothetical protein
VTGTHSLAAEKPAVIHRAGELPVTGNHSLAAEKPAVTQPAGGSR